VTKIIGCDLGEKCECVGTFHGNRRSCSYWKAEAAPAPTAEPVAAWMTEDGQRVVPAHTMEGARRDGGAMLSSLKPYTVALGKLAAPVGHSAATDDLVAIGAANPETVFAQFCDREGYPSGGEMDAALRAAFYEGINYCAVPTGHSAATAERTDLKRAGWFIYEGNCWVATSSDDPRATILYRAAPPAASGGGADLSKLTRWTFDVGVFAAVAADGQWVRFDDLRAALAAVRPTPTDAQTVWNGPNTATIATRTPPLED
jgi:hypothetical protein